MPLWVLWRNSTFGVFCLENLTLRIIKYDTSITEIGPAGTPKIFLAGPTVRGNQPHLISWRREAENEFKSQGFSGTLIVPEFWDRRESDKGRADLPLWEFEGLKQADVIMFWVPRTRELIGLNTAFEFGYWMERDREKIVYGRPDDAYRIEYFDIMWKEDAKEYINPINPQIQNTLASTVAETIKQSKFMMEQRLWKK